MLVSGRVYNLGSNIRYVGLMFFFFLNPIHDFLVEFFEPSTLSSENLTVNDHGGCEQQPLLLGEIQYFSTWHVHHPVNN